MGFEFVIEHMEMDEEDTKTVPPWVLLEYKHMRTLAGASNQVCFTNLSSSAASELNKLWNKSVLAQGEAPVRVMDIGVVERMQREDISLDSVCLLDPKAQEELMPEDGDGRFKWFLFGGILGDDPPRDRTSELRVLGFPSRHLGTVQMTTDTALGVTKMVVCDNIPLSSIPYDEFPTIHFNANESVEMPFRYIKGTDGGPIMPPGMKELLHADLDKGFDF